MNQLSGDKATKFVAWLSVAGSFLPKSMSIEEASNIFLRRCAEEDMDKEVRKNATKNN